MNNICNILLVVASLHPGGEKRNKRTFAGYRTKEKRVNRGTSTFSKKREVLTLFYSQLES